MILNLNLLNNLRKHLDYLYKNRLLDDENLKLFAVRHHKEFQDIFNESISSISSFFESEINLEYAYSPISDSELTAVKEKLKKYKMISENFKNVPEEVIR